MRPHPKGCARGAEVRWHMPQAHRTPPYFYREGALGAPQVREPHPRRCGVGAPPVVAELAGDEGIGQRRDFLRRRTTRKSTRRMHWSISRARVSLPGETPGKATISLAFSINRLSRRPRARSSPADVRESSSKTSSNSTRTNSTQSLATVPRRKLASGRFRSSRVTWRHARSKAVISTLKLRQLSNNK